MQRKYYNDEVKELLGGKDSRELIREMLQQMPWSVQPLPDKYLNTLDSRRKREPVQISGRFGKELPRIWQTPDSKLLQEH